MNKANRNAYSDEINKKRSQKQIGRKLYNNGEIRKFINVGDEVPEGFQLGDLPGYNKNRVTTKDTYTYTNGLINIHLKATDSVPEGFYRGSRAKGYKQSDESKKSSAENRKGLRRYTDGIINITLNPLINIITDGFYPGLNNDTVKKNSESHKGKKQSDKTIKKRFDTMRRNNTLNSSNAENNFYSKLIDIFGENDIARWYKDPVYNYACDFYIKSLNIFIELNLHWTHGDHPFDINNLDDTNKAENWRTNSSKFYQNAYHNWTVRDVKKLEILKENNLNYLVIYPNTFISNNVEDSLCQKILKKQ